MASTWDTPDEDIPDKSDYGYAECSNGILGEQHIIYVWLGSSNYTYELVAHPYSLNQSSYKPASYVISTGSASNTVVWTPPIEWSECYKNGTYVQVTIELIVRNGSERQSFSYFKIFNIPESIVPTVSFTTSDANGYLSQYGNYIQHRSAVKLNITESGVYGSEIRTCKIEIGSETYYTNLTYPSYILNDSGSVQITVTVEDTRGRTASASTTISVIPYTIPTVSITSIYRSNSSGSADSQGGYVHIDYSTSFMRLNSSSTVTVGVKTRVKGASTWTSIRSYTVNETSSHNSTSVFAANTKQAHEVCVTVTDPFGTVESTYRSVQIVQALLDFNRDANAIGIAAQANTENTLIVGLYTKFTGGINLATYSPNLLDNSNFANPVNQRTNALWNTYDSYAIDRWKTYNYSFDKNNYGKAGITISDGYITVADYPISQTVEGVEANAMYTLVVKNHNGSLYVQSKKLENIFNSRITDMYLSGSNCVVRIIPGTYDWAALYKGEYTAETLPPYQPKTYQEELFNCMRYYQAIDLPYVLGRYRNSTTFVGFIPLSVPMRIKPTMIRPTMYVSFLQQDSGNKFVYGNSYFIRSAELVSQSSNGLQINFTGSFTNAEYQVGVAFPSGELSGTNKWMILSADF